MVITEAIAIQTVRPAVLAPDAYNYPKTFPNTFIPREEQLDAYLTSPRSLWRRSSRYERKPFGALESSSDERVVAVKRRAALLPSSVSLEARAVLVEDALLTIHPLAISRRNGFEETDDIQYFRYLSKEVYGKDGLRDAFIAWNALADGKRAPFKNISRDITAFDMSVRTMMLINPALRIDMTNPDLTRPNAERLYEELSPLYQKPTEQHGPFTRRMQRMLQESTGRLYSLGLLPEPIVS